MGLANREELLEYGAVLLVQYQAIENRQHLLAVGVNAFQVFPERSLEVVSFHPLLHGRGGYVDILPQGVYVVPPEKEAVKEGGFPLGR